MVVDGVRVLVRELDGSGRESRLRVAALHVAGGLAVLNLLGVEQLRFGVLVGGNGLFGRHLHFQQRGGVLGALQRVGHHHGHRLASVVNLVIRQRQVAHGRANGLFAVGIVGRFGQLRDILIGKDGQHPGLLHSRRRVEAGDAALGYVAGFDNRVHQARQLVVLGSVLGPAHHFVAAVHAVQRLAHHTGGGVGFEEFRFSIHD